MHKRDRIIASILLCIICFTNIFTPVAYASTLVKFYAKQSSVDFQNMPELASNTTLPQVGQRSVLATSTSLLSADTVPLDLDGDNTNSANTRIAPRMEILEKSVYKTDEDVTVSVLNPDEEPFTTSVKDIKGDAVSVPVTQESDGTTTSVDITSTNSIRPGRYTIAMTDDQGQVTTQNFTWGVLAMNFDKSEYHPGETGDISFAVLNDNGDMVCNAHVTLQVTNQGLGINDTLSTGKVGNDQIVVNPQCQKHDFSVEPDYEAHYQFSKAGVYNMALSATTADGIQNISDSIVVTNAISFDVQRVSATRIYPPNTYPVLFNITAHQNFTGTITETVPDSFTITPATQSAVQETGQGGSVSSYDNMQTVYLNNNDPAANLQQAIVASDSSGLVMPFTGSYPITQGFGAELTDQSLQAFYTQFGLAGHDGVDFGVPMDTPLYAVDSGSVIWSGPGDYGITIIIQHGWGQSYYGHLSSTVSKVGQTVSKGELIGYSGESGDATGPHLHFGMRPNNPDMTNGYYGKIDPLPYLPFGHEPESLYSLASNGGLASTLYLGASENRSTSVLGASDSGEVQSISPTISPTSTQSALPILSPAGATVASGSSTVQSQNIPTSESTAAVTQSIAPTPGIISAESQLQTATVSANESFSVLEKQVQLNEALEASTQTEKVKVISWQITIKKGEKITLGYDYQAPDVSPQFYLLGPLKFYANGSNNVVFQEQRQWEIASDDVGVEWYVNTNPTAWNGYSWTHRRKIDISSSLVSTGTTYATPAAEFIDDGGDSYGLATASALTAWNSNADTGNIFVDNMVANTGPDSWKLTTNATGTTDGSLGEIIPSLVQNNNARTSQYVRFETYPTTNDDVINIFNTPNGATELAVCISPTGTIGVYQNTCTTQLGSLGPNLKLSTWYRIAFSYKVTSTTNYNFKLYVNGQVVDSYSQTSGGTTLTSGVANIVTDGWNSASRGDNLSMHVDDVYIDDGADDSDPGDIHVTAKLPYANGANSQFTTPIGAGNSGYGSGHAEEENERPINTGDGWESPATNNLFEEYSVESASQGDVDISQATLVASQAWVDADVNLSGGCSVNLNPLIVNNGVTSGINVNTTSFAVYSSIVNLSSYPSGNSAIGISSCQTGSATRNITLGEAGLEIAYIPSASSPQENIQPTFMEAGGDEVGAPATVTSANVSQTLWDGLAGTGDPTLDSTHSETGPDSWKFNSGASSLETDLYKNNIMGSTGRISVYTMVSNYPSTNMAIFCDCTTSGATGVIQVGLTTAGVLQAVNSTGTQLGSAAGPTLTKGVWYRIALSYVITSTTSYSYKLYVNGKLYVSYSQTSGGTALTSSASNSLVIGWLNSGSGANLVINFDDIYTDNGSDLSDPGNIHVTEKEPLSNGSLNQFTTSGTPSGFASGATNNAQYVSERPLDSTAYVQTSTASQTENYNVESPSQGDVNISSAGIIGMEPWIYADSGSACNAQLTSNGVNSTISLTTSFDMYASPSANANFLSSNQDVGMVSCTSNTNVKLAEAGVMMAYIAVNPATALTNFPVLVSISGDTDLANNAQSNGSDILFTDSTGQNLLNYEIEYYNAGTLVAWVQVPALSDQTDPIIYMYYGNPAATTSQANAPNTWGSNYAGVWHFSDQSGLSVSDSTGNNTATDHSATSTSTGQVDGAVAFSGTSQYVDLGSGSLLNPGVTNEWGVELWYKSTTIAKDQALVEDGSGGTNGYEVSWDESPCATSSPYDYKVSKFGVTDICVGTVPNDNNFHFLAVDYTTYGTFAYVDGALSSPISIDHNNMKSSTTDGFLGGLQGTSNLLTGAEDEVKISNTPISPGWIATEYNNQSSPTNFEKLGNVETSAYAPALTQVLRHGQFFGTSGAASGIMQPFTW